MFYVKFKFSWTDHRKHEYKSLNSLLFASLILENFSKGFSLVLSEDFKSKHYPIT